MKTCGSLAELEDGHQTINRDLYHHCKDSNCGMDDHHPKTMSIDHGKYMLLSDCGQDVVRLWPPHASSIALKSEFNASRMWPYAL